MDRSDLIAQDRDASERRPEVGAHDLEQRRLAGTVRADDDPTLAAAQADGSSADGDIGRMVRRSPRSRPGASRSIRPGDATGRRAGGAGSMESGAPRRTSRGGARSQRASATRHALEGSPRATGGDPSPPTFPSVWDAAGSGIRLSATDETNGARRCATRRGEMVGDTGFEPVTSRM